MRNKKKKVFILFWICYRRFIDIIIPCNMINFWHYIFYGISPFLLVDGHQSRFDLDFLDYINNDNHRWNVTLGVPYGTALWQVGDSSEQNGTFKMLLNEAKSELFRNRINMNKVLSLELAIATCFVIIKVSLKS